MLIVEKKKLLAGAGLAFAFFGVLILMFLPLRGGRNVFETSDRLFNSIAKGSSNHFQDLRREADQYHGSNFEVGIELKSESLAAKARTLLARAGVKAQGNGMQFEVSGNLNYLAGAIIDDSEAMFHNQGEKIVTKYGYPERETLFVWWNILKGMQKALESKGNFEAAALFHDITMRGVEVAYNFYGIEPKKSTAFAGVLTSSLVFYVLYTLWWGYAILFLFHGVGMEMKARSKKEV